MNFTPAHNVSLLNRQQMQLDKNPNKTNYKMFLIYKWTEFDSSLVSELISPSASVWKQYGLRVDVGGGPDGRLHGRLNPGVREGRVLSSKVNSAFAPEELRCVLQVLVRREKSEGAVAEWILTPLLHQNTGAERPDPVTVQQDQISESQLLQLFVAGAEEEEGVVRPGVGGQEDANGVVAWETVARVVDESCRPVGDALSPSDTVVLPEPLAEGQEDFGGAVVMDRPQSVHLLDGQRRVEVHVKSCFCGGRHQDGVGVDVAQRGFLVRLVGDGDACVWPADALNLGVQENRTMKQREKSSGQEVRPTNHLIVPSNNKETLRSAPRFILKCCFVMINTDSVNKGVKHPTIHILHWT